MIPIRSSSSRRAAMSIGIAFVLAASFALEMSAQGGRQGGPPSGPPQTPRAMAPVDLTGIWVSVVTEDWRWRMVTPPKNDLASIPLNAEGRKLAARWDLAADNAAGNQCRAFGAAGLMRQPTRVRVSWLDDTTLKLETDAGQQTRLFHFGVAAPPDAQRQWQGYSVAEWVKQPQSRGLGFGGRGTGVAGGNLKIVTTRMRSGYLRKNGVPYSEDAVLTEYYNRHSGPGSLEWFTVTTIVEDPKYLVQPYITSSSFKKETDDAKWHATPCQTSPPTVPARPAVP